MRKVRRLSNFIAMGFGFALLAGCTLGGELASFIDPVGARKGLMGSNWKQLQAIGAGLKSGNLADVADAARILTDTANSTPAVFQLRGLSGETRADPKIWENKAGFDKMAMNLEKAAFALVDAVRKNDKAGMQSARRAVGGTCAACHKAYCVPKRANVRGCPFQ